MPSRKRRHGRPCSGRRSSRQRQLFYRIKHGEEVTLSDINTTFITIEQMEAATDALLENGKKVGADSWQQRVKNQTPHCKFGEEGICCRI